MKKIFQIVLAYILGIVCVFTFVWRASDIDKKNNELAVKYDCSINEVYNY